MWHIDSAYISQECSRFWETCSTENILSYGSREEIKRSLEYFVEFERVDRYYMHPNQEVRYHMAIVTHTLMCLVSYITIIFNRDNISRSLHLSSGEGESLNDMIMMQLGPKAWLREIIPILSYNQWCWVVVGISGIVINILHHPYHGIHTRWEWWDKVKNTMANSITIKDYFKK